jgi:hypothetical protein
LGIPIPGGSAPPHSAQLLSRALSSSVQSDNPIDADESGLNGQMTATERYEALEKAGAPYHERFAALMNAVHEETAKL